jgi:hypothetical protein
MLPNWLYGKSKSKLASILGGGGGTPADYNQVKAQVNQNTEDIALLSDALDDKAALTQISNPNLLDNPWFTVNQRGITSWSNEIVGYSADRWKHDENATGSIINGVYTCNAPTYQIWEDDRITSLLGKTVTLSWILSDGSIGFETKTLPSALTSEYVNPFTNENVILALKSGNSSQAARIAAGVAIRAVKLELGSISTLAMDTAPGMATELLKCQRYFQRIKNLSASYYASIVFGIGYQHSSGVRIRTQLTINSMRSTPTITQQGLKFSTDGVTFYDAAINPQSTAYPYRGITLTRVNDTDPELVLGQLYFIDLAPSGYIDFNAEL